MKKMTLPFVLAALFAVSPAFAGETYLPIWQKFTVGWVSSDGSGGYAGSGSAPVQHRGGNVGWTASLNDTSTIVDLTGSYARLKHVDGIFNNGAVTTLDTFVTVPFLRFRLTPVSLTSNDVDTLYVVHQFSMDGVSWSAVDSIGHSILRSLPEPHTATGDSTLLLPATRNTDGGYTWVLDSWNMNSKPAGATSTTRSLVARYNYMRFIVKRHDTNWRGNALAGSKGYYNVDTWVWGVSPIYNSGSYAR